MSLRRLAITNSLIVTTGFLPRSLMFLLMNVPHQSVYLPPSAVCGEYSSTGHGRVAEI